MKIFDYLKSKATLVNENKKFRKERNTLELKYNQQTEEFNEFLKKELRFAVLYKELEETTKDLKSEVRQYKKELAEIKEVQQ